MTNPFGTMSTGGAWLSPKDHDGHVLIIANVKPFTRRYDEMRKAEVDVATFDYADVTTGAGWQLGISNSHVGITNKLNGLTAGAPPVLGRIGQAVTKSGMQAWVLADITSDPAQAGEVAKAAAWLAANPVPATSSPFTAPVAAPVAQAPVNAAQPQGDVSDLLRQLEAAQARG